jgi:Cu-Zn family superoxide dismutase
VPFALGDRRPASVIVHEAERTATEPGKAGTAGARVACLSVPFAQVTAG